MFVFFGGVSLLVLVVGVEGGHCIDLLLVVVPWWWCSALACLVEEFSAPCVGAFDCFTMFFEMFVGSV